MAEEDDQGEAAEEEREQDDDERSRGGAAAAGRVLGSHAGSMLLVLLYFGGYPPSPYVDATFFWNQRLTRSLGLQNRHPKGVTGQILHNKQVMASI